jgi:hypothetical protein
LFHLRLVTFQFLALHLKAALRHIGHSLHPGFARLTDPAAILHRSGEADNADLTPESSRRFGEVVKMQARLQGFRSLKAGIGRFNASDRSNHSFAVGPQHPHNGSLV